MDIQFRDYFLKRWKQYFPGAELPIAFYYTDDASRAPVMRDPNEWVCFIGQMNKIRHGEAMAFPGSALTCGGSKRYLGYTKNLRRNFEYFLSYGIEGEMEGERYKKTPELVMQQLDDHPAYDAPGKHLVCKRWDLLNEKDEPQVVVFFAAAYALAGLFTLANYDEPSSQGVIAPFGAGCASIIYFPYMEGKSDHPRAVLGMFDVSARPYVEPGTLTMGVPWQKFVTMVNNMDESFLITDSWDKVRQQMAKSAG